MKKDRLSFMLFLGGLFFAVAVFHTSCDTEKDSSMAIETEHIAKLLSNGQKSGALYIVQTRCGHTYRECNGMCSLGHLDCQGYGSTCAKSATLSVTPVSSTLYTGTTQDSTDLTDDPFFNMPDRSLFVGKDDSGTDIWLNIPAQLVYRDSVTRLFTFSGLYYSSRQVYKNQ